MASRFLSNSIDLQPLLKQFSASSLLELLKSVKGKKDLVLDNELICSLDYIANFSQLKTCDVEKVFKLEPGSSPGNTGRCVYMVRSSIKNTKTICDHINANRHAGNNTEYWIIYVPRKLYTCERMLEREGIYGDVTILEFPLGFIAIDNDVFSLELSDFYNCYYLKGDQTYMHTAAEALLQLCLISGIVPKISGHGRCAKMVIDIMKIMIEEMEWDSSVSEKICHLIIFDRDIDYVSLLLSQLTYEGLLDEIFGIKSGRITFPKEVTGKEEPMKFFLNNTDVIYEQIRNVYFPMVFGILSDQAKKLQSKSETSSMSLGDMKKFVTQEMKVIQQQRTSLSLHIGACEFIMEKKKLLDFQDQLKIEHDIIDSYNLKDCLDFVENEINKQAPICCALRLMCLLSVTQDGLQSKDYKSLVTQFLQSYGYNHLVTIQNLKKVGLFVEQGSSLSSQSLNLSQASKIAEKVVTAVSLPRYSTFHNISKKINLIPAEAKPSNSRKPSSMNYVYGGIYTPLIGRLTEQLILNNGIKTIEEGMKMLPGTTLSNINLIELDKESKSKMQEKSESKTAIVFVLGGITYAEIAALQLLGEINNYKIMIATTSITNGNLVMEMLFPQKL